MKNEKNILIAFLLNLSFSVFELVGGAVTGSIAILSDALHDIGDAASIGLAYFLERKSTCQPDESHTYGYLRYSVLGGFITTAILLAGSVIVIFNAVKRLLNPIEINYDGMIIFAVVGVIVNFAAAYFTREGDSVNQKAVNLHMLEDVLGWAVVLIGAVVMRLTDFYIIDPIMSIGVSVFIFINAARNLKEVVDLFLEKTPDDICVSEIREHLMKIEGVTDVHHIHIRSIDGKSHYATMHIVVDGSFQQVKEKVRKELLEHGIAHSVIELESPYEYCDNRECIINRKDDSHHHHHHHHH